MKKHSPVRQKVAKAPHFKRLAPPTAVLTYEFDSHVVELQLDIHEMEQVLTDFGQRHTLRLDALVTKYTTIPKLRMTKGQKK